MCRSKLKIGRAAATSPFEVLPPLLVGGYLCWAIEDYRRSPRWFR